MLLRVLFHAGQVEGAPLGIGLSAVKQGGVTDGTYADATAFVGDLVAKRGAFIAIGAEEAEFHQLVCVEEALYFFEKCRREAGFADFEGCFHLLAASAEESFLGTGEREVVHGKELIWNSGTLEEETLLLQLNGEALSFISVITVA